MHDDKEYVFKEEERSVRMRNMDPAWFLEHEHLLHHLVDVFMVASDVQVAVPPLLRAGGRTYVCADTIARALYLREGVPATMANCHVVEWETPIKTERAIYRMFRRLSVPMIHMGDFRYADGRILQTACLLFLKNGQGNAEAVAMAERIFEILEVLVPEIERVIREHDPDKKEEKP